MAAFDYQLVNFTEQLWREQTDVVFECLEVVVDICKSAVTEHLAQGDVFVDEFVQTVVVDVEVQADDTTDQNRPQGHAGAAIVFVHFGSHLVLQQVKDGSAQSCVGVDELQAFQNLWDVIT